MRYRVLLLTLALGLIGWTAVAQDEPKSKSDSPAKPTATKVSKGPLKNEVALKGTFEASDMTEVNVKPEVWAAFTVLKAVEPGTVVKKGDVLVEFDPEKIDRAIKDGEADQQLAELLLKSAEADMPLLERGTPLELAAAERAYQQAKEDYKKYLEIDLPLSRESTEMSLKSSKSSLENAREELKQLEKMYRSKDLTEETEEIILKRTRHQVEQSEFFYKLAEIRHKQSLTVDIPRREKDMKDGMEKAEIAYIRAKNGIPMGLKQKQVAFEKSKHERGRAAERYANLKKDRALFTVKSPADGVVYYGKCVQGTWLASAAKLQKGGSIMGDDAFMTIVKPGSLIVRTTADEKDIRSLAVGQSCKLSCPAFLDAKLTGTIDKVGSVPVGGTYEVRVKVNPTDVGIIAGMSAAIKVTTFEKKDALTIPAGLLQTDEADEDKFFVMKLVNGKSEKVFVKVGKRAGTKVEITDGLAEGDEVTAK